MTEPQTPLGVVSERALALLRPSMRKAMNPADEAFLQMRDRAMAHNDKVLAALPREDWEGRGDELLALYPEPELPQRLGEFLQLPGVVSLVAFVVNHDGMTLARTKSGTLKLAEDSTGLLATATLDPRNSVVADLRVAMERKDVDEMSFAFRILDPDGG